MKFTFFFSTALSLVIASRANTADIIILESPGSFTIHNQFEQPISASEREAFLPFSPLQVVRGDARLGDQITRAMQCQFNQKTFFLLKDEKGAIIGNSGRLRLLKACTLVGDTVETVRGSAVPFSDKSFSFGPNRGMLPKGARLILLFKSVTAYYARQTAPEERYGWVPVAARDAWKRVAQTAPIVDTAFAEDLRISLGRRIEAANAAYKAFFDRFNASTNQQKSIPRWSGTGKGAQCSWSLSEPYDRTGELDGSTAVLLTEMRDLLLGKPYALRYEKGRISLAPKKAGTP